MSPEDFNIQTYTPSILLKDGQWEFKHFNQIYTQNQRFQASNRVDVNSRDTYFSSINQFLYGLSPNLNLGFDIWIKSVFVSANRNASALQVLDFSHARNDLAVTGIGPKLKIAPFKKIQRLSIQSTFLLPARKDLENANNVQAFLEYDRRLWITQFFYDQPIGNSFQLFFQLAPWVSFTRASFRANNFIETPTSVFFSWFANDRITVYAQSEYWPTHYNDMDDKENFEAFYSWFMQSGLGLKYQLVPGFLEVEPLYTRFVVASDGQGAGQTFNFGIRLIN